jgi:hypothetical protein
VQSVPHLQELSLGLFNCSSRWWKKFLLLFPAEGKWKNTVAKPPLFASLKLTKIKYSKTRFNFILNRKI